MHIFTKVHCQCSLVLLLSVCASPPSVQVLDLPPRPVPVAPKEVLQPIPPAGYFLTRWREIFKPWFCRRKKWPQLVGRARRL